MISEKEAALCLPQLDVRFLTDSNSWNVNGTPNVRAVRQILRSTAPELSFGNILVARAVSAALQTPQLGGCTLSQGAQNSSPVTTWHPRESFDPSN